MHTFSCKLGIGGVCSDLKMDGDPRSELQQRFRRGEGYSLICTCRSQDAPSFLRRTDSISRSQGRKWQGLDAFFYAGKFVRSTNWMSSGKMAGLLIRLLVGEAFIACEAYLLVMPFGVVTFFLCTALERLAAFVAIRIGDCVCFRG